MDVYRRLKRENCPFIIEHSLQYGNKSNLRQSSKTEAQALLRYNISPLSFADIWLCIKEKDYDRLDLFYQCEFAKGFIKPKRCQYPRWFCGKFDCGCRLYLTQLGYVLIQVYKNSIEYLKVASKTYNFVLTPDNIDLNGVLDFEDYEKHKSGINIGYQQSVHLLNQQLQMFWSHCGIFTLTHFSNKANQDPLHYYEYLIQNQLPPECTSNERISYQKFLEYFNVFELYDFSFPDDLWDLEFPYPEIKENNKNLVICEQPSQNPINYIPLTEFIPEHQYYTTTLTEYSNFDQNRCSDELIYEIYIQDPDWTLIKKTGMVKNAIQYLWRHRYDDNYHLKHFGPKVTGQNITSVSFPGIGNIPYTPFNQCEDCNTQCTKDITDIYDFGNYFNYFNIMQPVNDDSTSIYKIGECIINDKSGNIPLFKQSPLSYGCVFNIELLKYLKEQGFNILTPTEEPEEIVNQSKTFTIDYILYNGGTNGLIKDLELFGTHNEPSIPDSLYILGLTSVYNVINECRELSSETITLTPPSIQHVRKHKSAGAPYCILANADTWRETIGDDNIRDALIQHQGHSFYEPPAACIPKQNVLQKDSKDKRTRAIFTIPWTLSDSGRAVYRKILGCIVGSANKGGKIAIGYRKFRQFNDLVRNCYKHLRCDHLCVQGIDYPKWDKNAPAKLGFGYTIASFYNYDFFRAGFTNSERLKNLKHIWCIMINEYCSAFYTTIVVTDNKNNTGDPTLDSKTYLIQKSGGVYSGGVRTADGNSGIHEILLKFSTAMQIIMYGGNDTVLRSISNQFSNYFFTPLNNYITNKITVDSLLILIKNYISSDVILSDDSFSRVNKNIISIKENEKLHYFTGWFIFPEGKSWESDGPPLEFCSSHSFTYNGRYYPCPEFNRILAAMFICPNGGFLSIERNFTKMLSLFLEAYPLYYYPGTEPKVKNLLDSIYEYIQQLPKPNDITQSANFFDPSIYDQVIGHLGTSTNFDHSWFKSIWGFDEYEKRPIKMLIYAPPGHGKTTLLSTNKIFKHFVDTDDISETEFHSYEYIITNRPELIDYSQKVLALFSSREVFNQRVQAKCPHYKDTWFDDCFLLLNGREHDDNFKIICSDDYLSSFTTEILSHFNLINLESDTPVEPIFNKLKDLEPYLSIINKLSNYKASTAYSRDYGTRKQYLFSHTYYTYGPYYMEPVDSFESLNLDIDKKFNTCLLVEYDVDCKGLPPHRDIDSIAKDDEVFTVSIGSRVLQLHYENGVIRTYYLNDGDVYHILPGMQKYFKHSIKENKTKSYAFTFRKFREFQFKNPKLYLEQYTVDLRVHFNIHSILMNLPKHDVNFDVCCGPGSLSQYLPDRSIGIDIDAEALEQYKDNFKNNLTYLTDILDFNFDNYKLDSSLLICNPPFNYYATSLFDIIGHIAKFNFKTIIFIIPNDKLEKIRDFFPKYNAKPYRFYYDIGKTYKQHRKIHHHVVMSCLILYRDEVIAPLSVVKEENLELLEYETATDTILEASRDMQICAYCNVPTYLACTDCEFGFCNQNELHHLYTHLINLNHKRVTFNGTLVTCLKCGESNVFKLNSRRLCFTCDFGNTQSIFLKDKYFIYGITNQLISQPASVVIEAIDKMIKVIQASGYLSSSFLYKLYPVVNINPNYFLELVVRFSTKILENERGLEGTFNVTIVDDRTIDILDPKFRYNHQHTYDCNFFDTTIPNVSILPNSSTRFTLGLSTKGLISISIRVPTASLVRSIHNFINATLKRKLISIVRGDTKNSELISQSDLVCLSKLNTQQSKALVAAFSKQFSIVQGPPGTGKTHLASYMALNAVLKDYKVLVLSSSHVAVDNLINKISNLFRLYGIHKIINRHVPQDHQERVNVAQYLKVSSPQKGCMVFGATLQSFLDSDTHYDLILIDEYSTCQDISVLHVLSNASWTNLVCLGDHGQLSNVLPFDVENKYRNFINYIACNKQYSTIVNMLDIQHRMSPEINQFISEKFYNSKLKCSESVETREKHFTRGLVLDILDLNVEFKDSKHINTEYIDKYILEKLLHYSTDIRYQNLNIAVLFYYSAQLVIFRHRIFNLDTFHGISLLAIRELIFLEKLSLCTVDGFQGRDADIVFISPIKAKGDFVENPNRFNVAVSRTKQRCNVVLPKYINSTIQDYTSNPYYQSKLWYIRNITITSLEDKRIDMVKIQDNTNNKYIINNCNKKLNEMTFIKFNINLDTNYSHLYLDAFCIDFEFNSMHPSNGDICCAAFPWEVGVAKLPGKVICNYIAKPVANYTDGTNRILTSKDLFIPHQFRKLGFKQRIDKATGDFNLVKKQLVIDIFDNTTLRPIFVFFSGMRDKSCMLDLCRSGKDSCTTLNCDLPPFWLGKNYLPYCSHHISRDTVLGFYNPLYLDIHDIYPESKKQSLTNFHDLKCNNHKIVAHDASNDAIFTECLLSKFLTDKDIYGPLPKLPCRTFNRKHCKQIRELVEFFLFRIKKEFTNLKVTDLGCGTKPCRYANFSIDPNTNLDIQNFTNQSAQDHFKTCTCDCHISINSSYYFDSKYDKADFCIYARYVVKHKEAWHGNNFIFSKFPYFHDLKPLDPSFSSALRPYCSTIECSELQNTKVIENFRKDLYTCKCREIFAHGRVRLCKAHNIEYTNFLSIYIDGLYGFDILIRNNNKYICEKKLNYDINLFELNTTTLTPRPIVRLPGYDIRIRPKYKDRGYIKINQILQDFKERGHSLNYNCVKIICGSGHRGEAVDEPMVSLLRQHGYNVIGIDPLINYTISDYLIYTNTINCDLIISDVYSLDTWTDSLANLVFRDLIYSGVVYVKITESLSDENFMYLKNLSLHFSCIHFVRLPLSGCSTELFILFEGFGQTSLLNGPPYNIQNCYYNFLNILQLNTIYSHFLEPITTFNVHKVISLLTEKNNVSFYTVNHVQNLIFTPYKIPKIDDCRAALLCGFYKNNKVYLYYLSFAYKYNLPLPSILDSTFDIPQEFIKNFPENSLTYCNQLLTIPTLTFQDE